MDSGGHFGGAFGAAGPAGGGSGLLRRFRPPDLPPGRSHPLAAAACKIQMVVQKTDQRQTGPPCQACPESRRGSRSLPTRGEPGPTSSRICRSSANLLLGLRRRLLVRRLEFWVKLGETTPVTWQSGTAGHGLAWGFAAPPGPGPSHPAKGCPGGLRLTAEDTEVDLRVDLVLCPARLLGLLLRQGPALLRIYEEQKIKKAV